MDIVEHANGLSSVMLYELEVTHRTGLRLLEDLSEAETQRSPAHDLSPIIWQIGHIACADAFFATVMGRPCTPPAGFEELFGRRTGGVRPYPPLPDVKPALETAHQALVGAAESMDLSQPFEKPDFFRNRGDVLVFACFHRGYHVGKIATLRALLNKPRLLE